MSQAAAARSRSSRRTRGDAGNGCANRNVRNVRNGRDPSNRGAGQERPAVVMLVAMLAQRGRG